MTTQFVNKRAIDTEELFQIINNSDGIYESALLKILQCNRISLESRLKTLEKNKMIGIAIAIKKISGTAGFNLDKITLESNAVKST